MIRNRFRPWTRAALPLLLAGSILSCSGEDIVFPGDDDDDDDATVTFTGTLDDVSPVTTRDIVVFVFNVDDEGTTCPCPAFPVDRSSGKAAVLEDGETEFTVSGVENGAIKVVFLLDNAGDDADGTIDEGDPVAVLDDEDCEIDDVEGGLTVTLTDVDIDFSEIRVTECQTSNPPLDGRARADLITQERTGDDSGD